MDKAMRDMWRMKHKAVQKQLNREAWALVRDDWHHARYLQFGVLTRRFVNGWLLAMMMLLLGLGGILLVLFFLEPERFYTEFTALDLAGFMQLRAALKTLLVDFSYQYAPAFGGLWMVMSVWHRYVDRAQSVRTAAGRLGSSSIRDNTQATVVFAEGSNHTGEPKREEKP
ncbi:hypothetical protein [Serratia marcescens]|uniref:hypothetical protein n=1 Tax=Serratia marcescens TaxID=615 RepID=UPI00217A835A|nr:hypothetical protein [Serratia marcescens]CAI2152911.1 Uncharacterised protein [Serratia marcescens]